MGGEKVIRWLGSSLKDLQRFPRESRREAGFELRKVQTGLNPTDWKPFEAVGPGTKEIRIRTAGDAYRVLYVAKFEEAIYVLHCFQKKTAATSERDKSIAVARYRAIAESRKVKQ